MKPEVERLNLFSIIQAAAWTMVNVLEAALMNGGSKVAFTNQN